jgi:hypothetical protein
MIVVDENSMMVRERKEAGWCDVGVVGRRAVVVVVDVAICVRVKEGIDRTDVVADEGIDDCVVGCVGETQSESKIELADNTLSRPRILVQEETKPGAEAAHSSCTLAKQATRVMLLEYRSNHCDKEMAALAAATRVWPVIHSKLSVVQGSFGAKFCVGKFGVFDHCYCRC